MREYFLEENQSFAFSKWLVKIVPYHIRGVKMSTTALTRPRSPEEAMREKISLLMTALKTLRGRDYKFDPQTINEIVSHVIGVRNLNQTSPHDTALATAIVMVSLNFALDFVAEKRIAEGKGQDKLTIAISLLEKNALSRLYMVAETHFRELNLAGRAEKLLKLSVLGIRGKDSSNRIYDLLDQKVYEDLSKWTQGEFSDYPGLPFSSKADEDAVVAKLKEIAVELKIAHKVNWPEVLKNDGISEFSANLFQRAKPGTPAAVGNIWPVFLLSLAIKTMGGGWAKQVTEKGSSKISGVEGFVYLNAPTIAKFIADLLLDPESLEKNIPQTAGRISGVATKPEDEVFAEKCSDKEILVVLAKSQQLLVVFAREAFQYYSPEDVEKPTDNEVDEFTRTRLLVFIEGDQRKRLARAEAVTGTLWTKIGEVKTLTGLIKRLAGFSAWPPEEQNKFIDGFDLEPFLPKSEDLEGYGHDVTLNNLLAEIAEAENGTELVIRLLQRINWNKRVTLVMILSNNWPLHLTENPQRIDWLGVIIGRINWSYERLYKLIATRGFFYHGEIAIKATAEKLTSAQWKDLLTVIQGYDDLSSLHKIWSAMNLEQKIQATVSQVINARDMGRLFQKGTVEEMRLIMEPVLIRVSSSRNEWFRFQKWLYVRERELYFNERDTRNEFIDTFNELCARYQPRQ